MRPKNRLNSYARSAADDFDTVLLSNRVHEQVQGQHAETDLARVVEASEQCYRIGEQRDNDDDVSNAAFTAGELLGEQTDTLVEEEVAKACAHIVENATEWVDHWDESEVYAAIDEARLWLGDHPDVARRIGFREVRADD